MLRGQGDLKTVTGLLMRIHKPYSKTQTVDPRSECLVQSANRLVVGMQKQTRCSASLNLSEILFPMRVGERPLELRRHYWNNVVDISQNEKAVRLCVTQNS